MSGVKYLLPCAEIGSESHDQRCWRAGVNRPTITYVMTAQELGDILMAARESAGRSQEDIAHIACVTGGYYSRLERGKIGDPGVRKLSQVALALGYTSLDKLLGRPIYTAEDLDAMRSEKLRLPAPEEVAIRMEEGQKRAERRKGRSPRPGAP